ncbi:hypothetical protein HOD29_01340 [archaeon]|jgi:hypothetical protein|nr:hypothetical protein [archaeon]
MNKRGEILIENVIFIILNLAFLMILVLFLVQQGNGAVVLESSYAKQIGLVIDSAKPGMLIQINMEKGKELAEKNGILFENVLKIEDNFLTVKLSDKGGYTYSFFNDVNVNAYLDDQTKFPGGYAMVISKK